MMSFYAKPITMKMERLIVDHVPMMKKHLSKKVF